TVPARMMNPAGEMKDLTPYQSIAVRFKTIPDQAMLAWVNRIPGMKVNGLLAPAASSSYFKRTYKIDMKMASAKAIAQLVSSPQIEHVEAIGEAELYSVTPATGKPATNDPLVNYQWGLKTTDQVILKEIDDINDEVVKPDPKGPSMDIGALDARAKIAGLKRDVLVAVVDSGADLTHPDLLPNIYKNEVECIDGQRPFPAVDDKDGNGFIGDCMGWNFSGRTPEGTNDADDNSGHGTHVSGVMAAVTGNGIGVAGVSNRIKILPINVTGKSSAEEPEEIRKGPDGKPLPPRPNRKVVVFADRVANAVLYAVKMKVDVINVSLGWPISVDADYLREAFNEARKAGIIIVAAAGNNTSGIPVFPCSYEGVICVGAATIDGSVSTFSNFGGQVDLMAPGEEILSTFPTALDSALFAATGYDLKNGTSQAAPYVSAQAALLRGMNPGISADQVLARLTLAAKKMKWGSKFGMAGSPDIERTLSVKAQPVVRPVFKTVSQILFNRDQKSFQIDLPIKNYWANATGVKINLKLAEKHLSLQTASFDLGSLAEGETKTLKISGTILDLTKPREAKLSVEVVAAGQAPQTFSQQLYLTRRLDGDSEVKTHILKLSKDHPKLLIRSIRTVREDDPFPQYMMTEVLPEGLAVTIIRLKNGEYQEEAPIMIPGGQAVVFAMRADLDYDGKNDYLFSVPTSFGEGDDAVRGIQFTMLKDDFSPVVKGQPHLPLHLDGAVIGLAALQYPKFMKFQTPAGPLAGYVFESIGFSTTEDLNPDKLEWEVNSQRERMFVYEPRMEEGSLVFKTRNYDNYLWSEKITTQLGTRARVDVEIANLLPQTDEDFKGGVIRALVKIGASSLKSYKLIKITGGAQLLARDFELSDTDLGGHTFEGADMRASIALDDVIPEYLASTSFGTILSRTDARVSALSPSGAKVVSSSMVRPNRATDHLMSFVQTYTLGSNLMSFFESKSQLIASLQSASGTTLTQQPIDRTSMLPDDVLHPFPLTAGVGAQKRPALYM
ncbi:MAG: S8 family peptidase, partial [Bdellovibrionota bacterium]